MGKGGESSVAVGASNKSFKSNKLDKIPTEELRKWAKAYGLNLKSEEDREVLVKELVRHLIHFSLDFIISIEFL